MEQHTHGRKSLRPDDGKDTFDTNRRSIIKVKELMGTALEAFSRIAEPRKKIDPEEEPGFAERNPQWEDELPAFYPHDDYVPDIIAPEGTPRPPILPVVSPEEKAKSQLQESAQLARTRWKTAYFSVKRQLALRDQSLRSSVGTGGQLAGRSFGVWDRYNPRRIFLFQLLYNKNTEYIICTLIYLHVLIIIFKASHKGNLPNPPLSMSQLNILDGVLTIVFSLECIGRIACLGFYKGPHSFLRNSYNTIDLLSVLDSWGHLIAICFFHKDTFMRFLVFRMFRALLALRDIEFFNNVLAIFAALSRSMEPLEDVLLLSLILLFFYSLIGLQFFGLDFEYRCVRITDGQISYPVIYCSHYADRGFKCPSNFVCKRIGGNPGYGVVTFDYIYLSLLTLFQVVTLQGWSLFMYIMGDVEYRASECYFITLVIILDYFVVNIVVAAICGVFLRVRHEHQK